MDNPPSPVSEDRDERMWAMLSHLAALTGYFVPIVGNIGGPLLVWLVKREQYPFVDVHGKESLNFQISITIYAIVAAVLVVGLIGFALLPAIVVFNIVMIVLAAVKANSGQAYRYPLTLRLVK